MEEDLREVKALVATCPKCGGAVAVGIKDSMGRAMSRRYGKLMEAGCDVYTTNVIVARTVRMCGQDSPCEGISPKKTKKKNEIDNQK